MTRYIFLHCVPYKFLLNPGSKVYRSHAPTDTAVCREQFIAFSLPIKQAVEVHFKSHFNFSKVYLRISFWLIRLKIRWDKCTAGANQSKQMRQNGQEKLMSYWGRFWKVHRTVHLGTVLLRFYRWYLPDCIFRENAHQESLISVSRIPKVRSKYIDLDEEKYTCNSCIKLWFSSAHLCIFNFYPRMKQ